MPKGKKCSAVVFRRVPAYDEFMLRTARVVSAFPTLSLELLASPSGSRADHTLLPVLQQTKM